MTQRNADRLEQPKIVVEQILHSAEEGAGMLHNITKPRLWRGGTLVLKDVFEDAQPLKRGKMTRVEGALAGRYTRAGVERQSMGKRSIEIWRKQSRL